MAVKSRQFGLGHFGIQRRSSKIAILGIAALMVSFLIGPATGDTADVQSGWQSRWEKTVAAAKKEGELRIYGSSAPKMIIQAGAFQKAFPEIKVVTVMPGRGAMAAQVLMTERRANKFLGDIVIGGTSTPMVLYSRGVLQPIKPALILPEVVDQSKWYGGKHRYPDPKGAYIFIFIGHPQGDTGASIFQTLTNYYSRDFVEKPRSTNILNVLLRHWEDHRAPSRPRPLPPCTLMAEAQYVKPDTQPSAFGPAVEEPL